MGAAVGTGVGAAVGAAVGAGVGAGGRDRASEPRWAQPSEPRWAQPSEPRWAQPSEPRSAQPSGPAVAQRRGGRRGRGRRWCSGGRIDQPRDARRHGLARGRDPVDVVDRVVVAERPARLAVRVDLGEVRQATRIAVRVRPGCTGDRGGIGAAIPDRLAVRVPGVLASRSVAQEAVRVGSRGGSRVDPRPGVADRVEGEDGGRDQQQGEDGRNRRRSGAPAASATGVLARVVDVVHETPFLGPVGRPLRLRRRIVRLGPRGHQACAAGAPLCVGRTRGRRHSRSALRQRPGPGLPTAADPADQGPSSRLAEPTVDSVSLRHRDGGRVSAFGGPYGPLTGAIWHIVNAPPSSGRVACTSAGETQG